MSAANSSVVQIARDYYNSDDADNFYNLVWGGEDIHIGIYRHADDDIAVASERTVATMAAHLEAIGADSRVIDVGAGYGGAARWLARTYGCRVSCVNLSEAQNGRNRELSAAQRLSERIEVVDANFEDIPFADQQFDIAWSQDAILHSGRRTQVLAEVDRVLKPGGQFIFTDPMQADDCPAGVLQPVLDRIHLETLASLSFYRSHAEQLGWEEVRISVLTPMLVKHYTRVREELTRRRDSLRSKVSDQYMNRMIEGLGHWIEAGAKGYLRWGVMYFRKPE
jgi:sarcosine/dimethylglycine N-methyltransferase